MASSTYLTLVNKLLNDFNEPEISSTDFPNARSVTRVAKNAINNSIRKIQTDQYFWPFNRTQGTQVLTAGTNLYSWPSDYKIADMNSFYVEKDDTLGVSTMPLYQITQEEWFEKYRKWDFDNSTTGTSVPEYIFDGHNGWGITPNPDKAYTIKYEYFITYTDLVAHDDTPSIPQEWDHVIYLNAYPYMNKFYENEQEYQSAMLEGRNALARMRSILVNDEFKLFVNQVRRRRIYA